MDLKQTEQNIETDAKGLFGRIAGNVKSYVAEHAHALILGAAAGFLLGCLIG